MFNFPKTVCVLASLALCGSPVLAETAPGASGTVSFRHWETKNPCSVAVPDDTRGVTWTYVFVAYRSPCENNVAETIEMLGAPSALRILLTDNEFCQKLDDFWIELRTTRKVTTFAYIPIPELLNTPVGGIVLPGLQLVGYHRKDGTKPLVKALSCVQITRSAVPPG